jgi:hypothetical protein
MKKCCSHEGCKNGVVEGVVCVTHGAKVKRCSHEGCANGVIKKAGVCHTHFAVKKRCSHEGCANEVRKEGLCWRHGTKSLAIASCEEERPPQLSEELKATTASGIARKGREIGVDYLQTNISTAAAHQSPSPRPSTTTLDSSDGEELGAWIYMNWRRTKTLE